jgi:hypothetical protein
MSQPQADRSAANTAPRCVGSRGDGLDLDSYDSATDMIAVGVALTAVRRKVVPVAA